MILCQASNPWRWQGRDWAWLPGWWYHMSQKWGLPRGKYSVVIAREWQIVATHDESVLLSLMACDPQVFQASNVPSSGALAHNWSAFMSPAIINSHPLCHSNVNNSDASHEESNKVCLPDLTIPFPSAWAIFPAPMKPTFAVDRSMFLLVFPLFFLPSKRNNNLLERGLFLLWAPNVWHVTAGAVEAATRCRHDDSAKRHRRA